MKKLYDLLGKILEIDPKIITDRTSPANTPTWDSYNALLMISEIEAAFKAKFTMDEVMKVKNVGDIKRVLKKYGIDIV